MSKSERIRSFREELGYTQTEFAKICGYKSYTVIADWENNRKLPNTKTVERLYRRLDLNIHWYLTGEGPMKIEKEAAPYPISFSMGSDSDKIEITIPHMEGQEFIEIPILDHEIAAGFGMDITLQPAIEDSVKIIANTLSKRKNYFGIKVSGDSMEPAIGNGYTAIIEMIRTTDLLSLQNKIVAAKGPDGLVLKNLTHKDGRFYLTPENTIYPTIEFSSEHEIIGKLVMAVKEFG